MKQSLLINPYFFIFFLIAWITPISIFGASISWDGGASTSNWDDDLNWSGDVKPTPSDDVTITSANVTIGSSTLNVTFNYTPSLGHTYTIFNAPTISGTFNTINVSQLRNNKITLHWQTASETNNRGFESEHSTEGNYWRNIDFVKGNGTSYKLNKYQFIHELPVSGMNYYRLKQLDYGGNFEYSEIRSVNFENDNIPFIQIFPNPIKEDLLNVNIGIELKQEADIRIYDLTGKIWLHQPTFNTENQLNINELFNGIYIVETVANGQMIRQKLIKN